MRFVLIDCEYFPVRPCARESRGVAARSERRVDKSTAGLRPQKLYNLVQQDRNMLHASVKFPTC
jgi:hypothetical protein